MNRKFLPFTLCLMTLMLTGYSDTDISNTESSGEVYTAKALGLIDSYLLSCSYDTQTLYMSASTNGNERMKEIGMKNITIEKSSDKINWQTERTVSDMTLNDESVCKISGYVFSVEGDSYYRITLEHYAEENKLWFPQEQSIKNTSSAVYIPSQEQFNRFSLTKDILQEDIVIDEDTVIPSGSTAFTVNVEENQGFCLFGLDMNIGAGYDIITGADGRPLFTKCDRVNTVSSITGAVNGEKVAFTGLFDVNFSNDGGLITFYADERTDSGYKNYNFDSSTLYSSKWTEYGAGINYLKAGLPLEYYGKETSSESNIYNSVYISGDFNNDMSVDLKDAYIAFFALYSGDPDGKFEHYKNIAPLLFPDIADIRAAFIWNDFDDSDDEMIDFSNDTYLEILQYCADISAGKSHMTDSHLCEVCHINYE